jgi:hypothetical protein
MCVVGKKAHFSAARRIDGIYVDSTRVYAYQLQFCFWTCQHVCACYGVCVCDCVCGVATTKVVNSLGFCFRVGGYSFCLNPLVSGLN